MELILLEKVQNLGELGDVVKVKNGYGRNYLLPQGKAIPATAENKAEFEKRRAELEKAANDRLVAARARADELDGTELTMPAKASAEGKLYGSIGPREIAEALTEQGKPVQKSEVIMGDGPVRTIGEFEIVLKLHADVSTAIKLIVVEDEG